MDYYLIRCLLNNSENFCIWYANEKDGLLCDNDRKILSFSSIDSAMLYLSQKDLHLYDNSDVTTYDFDKLKMWINNDDTLVNSEEFLNAWNLFTDIAYTVGAKFEGDKKNKSISLIYDKLFFGSNMFNVDEDKENKLVNLIYNELVNSNDNQALIDENALSTIEKFIDNENYVNLWDIKQIVALKNIMKNGLDIFIKNIGYYN